MSPRRPSLDSSRPVSDNKRKRLVRRSCGADADGEWGRASVRPPQAGVAASANLQSCTEIAICTTLHRPPDYALATTSRTSALSNVTP